MWQAGQTTDYQDMLVKLIAAAVNRHLATAAVNAAGTGYVVGDTLTIDETGGIKEESLGATVEVTSVGGSGDVTGVRVVNGGAYSTDPSTTTGNTTSGGTGSGCTLDITFADTGWTTHRNQTAGSPSEREWIGEGEGTGTDEIFVGIKTYRNTGTSAFNWELAGFTGFSSGLDWGDQPGFSGTALNTYVPLRNGTVRYWLSITGSRIIGVFEVGGTYTNMYLGFLNRFATPSEYPYPLYVGGCTNVQSKVFNDSDIFMSGGPDPIYEGSFDGPHAVRFTDGQWYAVANSGGSSATRNKATSRVVYPCSTPSLTPADPADDVTDVDENNESWGAVIGFSGVSPDPNARLHPTPDSGGDLTVPIPTIVLFSTPSDQVVGELDSVFWISTAGSGLVSEDRIVIGSDRYHCFQNCNRTDQFAFLAVREG